MKALITGASSGIGKEFAIQLNKINYDLVLVGRNKAELEQLKNKYKLNCEIFICDLANINQLKRIDKVINLQDIDLLVNCAGIGSYGYFSSIDFEEDLDLINTNIVALHYLTKQYIKAIRGKKEGYLLNVSSTAAYQPGPIMASYYASKSYVYSLTCALYEEEKKNNINISLLLPGPVDTNFNKKLGIKFGVKPMKPKQVVKYTLRKLECKKLIIIPGISNKIAVFFSKFIPLKIILKITKKIQEGKKYEK